MEGFIQSPTHACLKLSNILFIGFLFDREQSFGSEILCDIFLPHLLFVSIEAGIYNFQLARKTWKFCVICLQLFWLLQPTTRKGRSKCSIAMTLLRVVWGWTILHDFGAYLSWKFAVQENNSQHFLQEVYHTEQDREYYTPRLIKVLVN